MKLILKIGGRMKKKNGITLRILPAVLVFAMIITACGAPQAMETAAPATEAPATEAPVTEAPATEAPATEAPTEPATTIKIGMLTDLTSTFTPWGVNVRDGMALAAQEINDAGGVNGRMIEIIAQDDENDGDIGVDRF